MFVRTLIGRQAGEIIELPLHAAEACLSNGTCSALTTDEIAVWTESSQLPPHEFAETKFELPEGFEAVEREDGLGFDLFRAVPEDFEGEREALNPKPLPNLAAARDLAASVAEEDAKVDRLAGIVIPDAWAALGNAELLDLGKQIVPTTKTVAKAKSVIQAELDRRAVLAKAAAEAGANPAGETA